MQSVQSSRVSSVFDSLSERRERRGSQIIIEALLIMMIALLSCFGGRGGGREGLRTAITALG